MNLTINGEERSFDDRITLAALIEQMGMKQDRVAVELNRDIVQRDRWSSTVLNPGDHLEIVHFVGGGFQPSSSASFQLCRLIFRLKRLLDFLPIGSTNQIG